MVAQKIKASASNKGFTLVELIVVITILAILGTIGFISIQGYSAQSRDSKRTSDLRSLASAMTIGTTNGVAMTSFVTAADAQHLIGDATAVHVGGLGMGTGMVDYVAGTPNFTALSVNPSNFKDGTTDYKVGTANRDGGVFQLAATLENGGSKVALLTGNYNNRAVNSFAASGALGTVATKNLSVSNLTGSGVGYFQRGDVVWVAGIAAAGTGSISAVGGDGKSFSVTLATATTGNVTTITLGQLGTSPIAEAGGLVRSTVGVTTPVGNGTTNLPYN